MATILGNAAVGMVLAACVAIPVPRAWGEAPFQASVTHDDEHFRFTDQRTGKTIIETDETDFHYHVSRRRAALEPAVEIVPYSNGFNAVFTFTNNRAQPMPMGAMEFKGLKLGDTFGWRDFEYNGEVTFVSPAEPISKFRFGYPHGPNKHYSPVAVMETPTHVIGFNLLFPVMELEHETLGVLSRMSGGDWKFQWKLSNYGNEGASRRMRYEATLAPGETRSYTIAVRVTNDHEKWLETLSPYKEFFTSTYGGVTYERDPRPVRPFSLAGESGLDAQNPYGFRQESRRPDLYGWGPLLDWYSERGVSGERIMFWQPTGLQLNARENNFPFKFTTFWMEGNRHQHEMGDAPQEFRRFASRENVDFGLWWGHSTRVATTWDVLGYENLDVDNPQHVAIGFRELDLAVQAGATFIGLDAFGNNGGTPAWELVKWIELMRERHPDITFITEKQKPDILHRVGGTFYQAYNKSRNDPDSLEDVRFIDGPLYLADYLLPGHETWLSFRYNVAQRAPGVDNNQAFRQREVERALQMGYIPVSFGGVDYAPNDTAVESWEHTVPDDLRGAGAPVGDSSSSGAPTAGGGGASTPDTERDSNPRDAIKSTRTVRTHTKPKKK